MSDTIKLKQCPFCGGEAKITISDREGNDRESDYELDPWSGLSFKLSHYHEENDGCPIAKYECDGANVGVYLYDSREEAAEAWNKRFDIPFNQGEAAMPESVQADWKAWADAPTEDGHVIRTSDVKPQMLLLFKLLASSKGEAARLREENARFQATFRKLKEIECTIGRYEEDKASFVGSRVTQLYNEMREALSSHTEDTVKWYCHKCGQEIPCRHVKTEDTGIQKVREAVEAIEGEMIEVYGPKAERIRRRLDCIRSVLGITIPGITDSSDASSEHVCGDCQEESNELVSGLCPKCYAAWEEEGCLE